MKPSKLEGHLRRCHPDKRSKDLKYFQILKEKLQKRPTMDRMFALTECLFCKEAIMLDESTLPGNESLLLAYVRFMMDQEHQEEMLFARTLTTDTVKY
ncbi:SCAN domain-containing protein 3 [Trichonephila clavipes]|nr:SCAN domain-containing protein 3 [Trichonephila clavipes]